MTAVEPRSLHVPQEICDLIGEHLDFEELLTAAHVQMLCSGLAQKTTMYPEMLYRLEMLFHEQNLRELERVGQFSFARFLFDVILNDPCMR
jgi:hypothetical protein